MLFRSGRMALEAKDRLFVGRFAGTVPEPGDPPPFDPGRPEENAIAFCLWGNAPRYLVPLRENVRLMPHLFPSWHMRVYVGSDVEPSFVGWLRENNVDCREMHLEPGVPPSRRLLWRFETMSDRSLRRFLIRDADSLLNIKERVAVDAWLQSRYRFHAMRDWYTHTDLILAGMWGGVGGVLPPLIGIRATFFAAGAVIFAAFLATALLILNDDMPYLVDSIVMAMRKLRVGANGVLKQAYPGAVFISSPASLKTMTDLKRYDQLKQQYGTLHQYGLQLQQRLTDVEDSQQVEQLMSAIRNSMYACKSIKDVLQDLALLRNSSQEFKFQYYQVTREHALSFYGQLIPLDRKSTRLNSSHT